jgi:dihydroflavonol-4-reductase
MSVVVTGASGHVGANLVRELLRRGRRVRALVRQEDPPALRGLDVERVLGDARDSTSLRRAFAGAEVVYHLAAVISITGDQGGLVFETNVAGARNAAAAALECGARRMVHFCSVHAFDSSPLDETLDETRARVGAAGFPAYDRSKAAGEAEVREVVRQGLDAVIVHPTGIIGPHDYKLSRMGELFLRLYERRIPALLPGGFDWVDVRDVVDGAIAAEEKGGCNESYLLSGHWASLRELATLAERVTGVRAPRWSAPMALARLGALLRPRWLHGEREPLFTWESLAALRANRNVSHAKAERELGYRPRPLEESVRVVYEGLVATGRIPEIPLGSRS